MKKPYCKSSVLWGEYITYSWQYNYNEGKIATRKREYPKLQLQDDTNFSWT